MRCRLIEGTREEFLPIFGSNCSKLLHACVDQRFFITELRFVIFQDAKVDKVIAKASVRIVLFGTELLDRTMV